MKPNKNHSIQERIIDHTYIYSRMHDGSPPPPLPPPAPSITNPYDNRKVGFLCMSPDAHDDVVLVFVCNKPFYAI